MTFYLKSIVLILVLILIPRLVNSQIEERVASAIKINSEIVVDGIMDEIAWESAEVISDFRQKYPNDTSLSRLITNVSLMYDDKNLYIAAECMIDSGAGFLIESLRRDFEGDNSDAFYVILDPFMDKTSGLLFALNPFGVQREGLIINGGGGRFDKNDSWDNKWFAEVKRYKDRWVMEMALPFKTLRFKSGCREWRVNFARVDYSHNEFSNWNWLPKNQSNSSLAFTGILKFQDALKDPGANVSFIPYLSGGMARDFEEGTDISKLGGLGADAKIALSSSLNLDLTVNPDFSQVEVDRQVMNLDRFEIYFPEKRQFFLENSDIFSEFGSRSLRPFFSRRIGVARDTFSDEVNQNAILMGTRFSGKLNKNWRMGMMDIQTANEKDFAIPAMNYAVATLHRRLLARSSLSGIFINKSPVSFLSNKDDSIGIGNFNRVAGLDLNLASKDNMLTGKVFYHNSFEQDNADGQYAHGGKFQYNNPNFIVEWEHEMVGKNYNAEVGFVRRVGYKKISPMIGYHFYPDSKTVQRHSIFLMNETYWSENYGVTDRSFVLRYFLRTFNRVFIFMGIGNEYVKLTESYDPTGTDAVELPANTDYNYRYFFANYYSNPVHKFKMEAEFFAGEYYNGYGGSFSGELGYRIQPFGSIFLNFGLTHIALPEPYATANLILLGPKIDITFSRELYFSTLVQYNNQIDNLNINARLQWRYKPVSDLYLVYTDNYFAQSLKKKSRALIFKITYWLNC